MIPFQPLHDEAPALRLSPLLTATLKTFDYIVTNGPIGLTPSKALKRYFVDWAAEAFDWSHYGTDYLYGLNKVLNEADFMPLAILHDVWLGARLVRHYKGKLCLTKAGQALRQQPATLWAVLANYYLCDLDQTPYTRFGDRLQGNWSVFLNLLNIEAQTGITDSGFASLVTGMPEMDHQIRSLIYVHVLRPLAWAGLLIEHRSGRERLFTKSPLWADALKLETDAFLQPVTQH
ncbi:hypothetical protein [Novosphingobium aquae]|uniref:Uncharacterized protein n=1 Tax=Novosphingobium aquae TaxID=3133435 RepID=A0ABU8SD50_9SPHN